MENHSLTCSTKTRQGGLQLANMISSPRRRDIDDSRITPYESVYPCWGTVVKWTIFVDFPKNWGKTYDFKLINYRHKFLEFIYSKCSIWGLLPFCITFPSRNVIKLPDAPRCKCNHFPLHPPFLIAYDSMTHHQALKSLLSNHGSNIDRKVRVKVPWHSKNPSPKHVGQPSPTNEVNL